MRKNGRLVEKEEIMVENVRGRIKRTADFEVRECEKGKERKTEGKRK